jgi:hypothetical protein
LVRKNPGHYSKFWEIENIDAPLWWPVPLIDKKQNKRMVEYWKGIKQCHT